MKKHLKLLLCAAIGIGTFIACEDVPEPYNIPTENGGNTPSADYIISQSFTSSLGDFTSESESGTLAWTSSSKYGAIITGYDDWDGSGQKSNRPGVTYLVSSEIDLADCDSAYVVIDQAINYAKTTLADDHHLLIRLAGMETWTELPMSLDGLGTSFTYVTSNIQLPQEYMGQKVQLALKHVAHDSYSSTWEVKSIKVAKGTAPTTGGNTPVGDLVGSGTKDDPYDVPSTIKLIAAGPPSTKIYTKGVVSKVEASKFDASYGTLIYYISNDGSSTDALEVYRGYGLGGAKFTSADLLQQGDSVIVYGQVLNYNGTPEFTTGSQLYFLNGEYSSNGEPSGEAKGSGTKEDPFNVAAAVTGSGNAWVKAYIVGWIEGQNLAEGAHFNGNSTVASNLLIADSPDETDVANCMPVQLLGGSDARSALNLQDNPGNYKKEVMLYGSLEKYFGAQGIKSVSDYVIDGQGGETPSGDVLFSEPFSADQGAFTIDNKNLPSGISAVWTFSASYGMVATAYDKNSKANYASESWLVSPEIDLSAAKNATLTFSHGANYFSGACKDECSVLAKAVGDAEWKTLTVSTWPAHDFKFVSSGDVDLKAFVGKKMQFAFRYTSTEKKAGTWEIKKVLVEDRAAEGSGGDDPNPGGDTMTLADFTNGDFETWVDGKPVNWESSSSKATLSQSTVAHGGQYSCRVEYGSQNQRLAYKDLSLEAGTYTVTAYVRAAEKTAVARIGYHASAFTYGPNTDVSTEWQQLTYTFELSSSASVSLLMMNSASGADKDAILVDDYTITKN